MTIVMEEESLSSTITSFSTLSPQTNYQTLIDRENMANNYVTSSSAVASASSISVNSNSSMSSSSISPNLINSSCSDSSSGYPYAIFIFRPNNGNINNSTTNSSTTTNGTNGNVSVVATSTSAQNNSSMNNSSNNNNGELFEERRIALDKPCKIGRSVAKLRPEPNNAIFDCKVLSRNHALLWEESGKYFIQDTKSSNGTFLNGSRLGKSNEDSTPFEITSGDIVQFGVDVTENTKKVTHGCITVEIRLFNKNGEEIIDRPQQNSKIDVQTQELYQLALFLKEAMMREEVLNKKLRTLQTFIDQAKENSENGWLTLIQEDRLLSRIDCLEKKSLVNNKVINEENYKNTINTLRDEKLKIENAAKEAIEKIIVEKNTIAQQFDDLKANYSNLEEEYNQLYKLNDELKTKIFELAEKNQDLLNKLDTDELELNELKKKHSETLSSFESEKSKNEKLITELTDKEKTQIAKIELLLVEKDLHLKQIQSLQEKLEQEKNKVESKSINKMSLKMTNDDEIELNHYQDHNHHNHNHTDSNQVELIEDESCLEKNLVVIKQENEEEEKEEPKEILNHLYDLNKPNDVKARVNLSSSNRDSASLTNFIDVAQSFSLSNEVTDMCINELESKNLETNLKKATERIAELEYELREKNASIEKLLISKNELINMNFKEILSDQTNTMNDQYSIHHTNVLGNSLTAAANKENSSREVINNSKNEVDLEADAEQNLSLSFQDDSMSLLVKQNVKFDAIQSKINSLLNNLNQSNNETNQKESTKKELEDICNALDELKSNMKQQQHEQQRQNESAVIMRQLESSRSDYDRDNNNNNNTTNNISKLSESKQSVEPNQEGEDVRGLNEKYHNYEEDLKEKQTIIDELREGYDFIFLRAKIVSYFSMIPLIVLLIALMIAFYPTLATITATGL